MTVGLQLSFKLVRLLDQEVLGCKLNLICSEASIGMEFDHKSFVELSILNALLLKGRIEQRFLRLKLPKFYLAFITKYQLILKRERRWLSLQ